MWCWQLAFVIEQLAIILCLLVEDHREILVTHVMALTATLPVLLIQLFLLLDSNVSAIQIYSMVRLLCAYIRNVIIATLLASIECPYAINQTGESHPLSFITVTVNGTSRLETSIGTGVYTNETVIISTVDSSFCRISGLEVYRGREQAIEISHEGISLGNSGTIEV